MKTLLTSLLLAFGVFLISPAPAKPNLLIVCANDLGETTNLAAAQPEKLAGMQTLLERLIVQGRSTPWARRKNDQRVNRYPVSGIRWRRRRRGKGSDAALLSGRSVALVDRPSFGDQRRV